MTDVDANKEVVHKFMEFFSNGDVDQWASLMADDATYEITGSSTVSGLRTKNQIVAETRGLLSVFPKGIHIKVRGLTAEGERVALEAVGTATTASGFVYNNSYHMLFIVRNGKVQEAREYLDTKLLDRMAESLKDSTVPK